MENKKYLNVIYDDEVVGKLAYTNDRQIVFQYDASWVKNGFSLNPFYLPLDNEVHVNTKKMGMPFSVFLDSMPDAWGQYLLAKKLKSEGVDADKLNILDKLSLIVDNRKGRLRYEPSSLFKKALYKKVNLDEIQDFSLKIIKEKNMDTSNNIVFAKAKTKNQGNYHTGHLDNRLNRGAHINDIKLLDKIYRQAGSTGGARPKINLLIDDDIYIVKFASHIDIKDIGLMEYNCNVLAEKCGINVSDYKLLPSKECKGYFATKRFDNTYTVTIAGLLEVEYDIPSIDYNDIFKLVRILTNDNKNELLELFRRMCFNVYIGNQDDHAKNFSMQYMRDKGIWRMSPTYDLTKSTTSFGEQTTTVNGKGKNITDDDLMQVGVKAKINEKKLKEIVKNIRNCLLYKTLVAKNEVIE